MTIKHTGNSRVSNHIQKEAHINIAQQKDTVHMQMIAYVQENGLCKNHLYLTVILKLSGLCPLPRVEILYGPTPAES